MKKISLTAAIVFICISAAFSHPHVFIDYSVTFIFNDSKIKGVQVSWVFDEMFSSTMIHDYDLNHDGVFSGNEVNTIREEAFSNLKNYNYFSHLNLNGTKVPVKKVKYFTADILKGSRLMYSFFIPVQEKEPLHWSTISYSVYDKTYFCSAAERKEQPATVKGLPRDRYTVRLKDNSRQSYYNNAVVPREIVLRYRSQ